MKTRSILLALLFVSWFSLFGAPLEAQAGITVDLTDRTFGELYNVSLAIRSTSPITAIGNVALDGPVHQVSNQTVFAEQCGSFEVSDTHLLFSSSQLASFASIVESNDYSNPVGVSSYAGMGTFGQSDDTMMRFKSQYQQTDLSFLRLVTTPENFANVFLALTVETTDETLQIRVSPWPIEGTCGYYCPVSYDFGNVRVGTTASKPTNIGQAGVCFCVYDGSMLENVVAPFSRNASSVYFSPHAQGSASLEAAMVGLGGGWPWTAPTPIPMTGSGVGPVFDASQTPGSTLEFGDAAVDSFLDVLLDVSNITDDGDLGDLTRLTVSAEITGDAAGAFEVISQDLLELLAGQTDSLRLRFNAAGLAPGNYLAQLVLGTDVGAACGATGQGAVYCFDLSGTVVPEPSTLVAVLGLLAFGVFRFTRRTKS
ncbi:MAG: PEP-CTERM sorting domain-containing protein [Pirellulales bacterium]|nr:PEP-CTERM sorting domain-containing protein [Pirellulales bacterium]